MKYEQIMPVFEDNYVALVVSSSDEYVPYLSVLLASLCHNASELHQYDVVVFEKDLSLNNKKILQNFVTHKNISLRFYNPSRYMDHIDVSKLAQLRNLNSFYRVFVPEVMRSYKKVVFTDSDLVFHHDLYDILDVDLEGKMLGAVPEPLMEVLNAQNIVVYEKPMRTYIHDILKLPNPRHYFNTGVLIFDIQKCNEADFTNRILSVLTPEKYIYLWQEQCIMTHLFNDQIQTIPFSWNFEVLLSFQGACKILHPDTLKYIVCKEKNIIHFVASSKPWNMREIGGTEEIFYSIWWQYARKSPYYETLLERRMEHKLASKCEHLQQLQIEVRRQKQQIIDSQSIEQRHQAQIFLLAQYPYNLFLYFRYRILLNFVWGKKKKKYQAKKDFYKQQVNAIKQLRKGN